MTHDANEIKDVACGVAQEKLRVEEKEWEQGEGWRECSVLVKPVVAAEPIGICSEPRPPLTTSGLEQ